jgi:hypothetical protein
MCCRTRYVSRRGNITRLSADPRRTVNTAIRYLLDLEHQ